MPKLTVQILVDGIGAVTIWNGAEGASGGDAVIDGDIVKEIP